MYYESGSDVTCAPQASGQPADAADSVDAYLLEEQSGQGLA